MKVFPGHQGCPSSPTGGTSTTRRRRRLASGVQLHDQPRILQSQPGHASAGARPDGLRRRRKTDGDSGAPWQLVTTFNEWGEGTAVESAAGMGDASGFGTYLDILHSIP